MGVLIDFQEAKNKLTAVDSTKLGSSVNEDLNNAVAMFAFSRLEKRNRVSMILAGVFGGEPEQYLDKADEVAQYAASDFAVPYKAKAAV